MNAETTACQVLTWAGDTTAGRAGSPAVPPPTGPLRDTSALGRPGAATLRALRALTRDTAARLGAGSPPFADPAPVGPGALLMAAAVGGRAQPGPARTLAEAAPAAGLSAAGGWADALARHAVVAPALAACRRTEATAAGTTGGAATDRSIDAELAETLLRASILTAVLHRPPLGRLRAGATAAEVAAAAGLLTRPRGRAVLTTALAAWSADPAVLDWRAELLTRLSIDHPGVVLDVYLLARLRHGAVWDRRLAWAARALSGVGLPDDLPLATVRFWAPLAGVNQRDPDLIRSRALLDGHRAAVDLVRRYRLGLSAGAAWKGAAGCSA
jgi:hypothetical protein